MGKGVSVSVWEKELVLVCRGKVLVLVCGGKELVLVCGKRS